jgi:acyl-CoA reductase-like NAD-dependent aldehyde dehydrogenase
MKSIKGRGVAGLTYVSRPFAGASQRAKRGGSKYSGVGREFGTFGIEAFLESRAILE